MTRAIVHSVIQPTQMKRKESTSSEESIKSEIESDTIVANTE